jgi:hypothetical protein
MKKLAPCFFLLLILPGKILAQDTLPKFSVTNAGNNRIIIGWVNKLMDVKQISIQRSFDSLQGYKSILTVADPTTLLNGYLDAKANNDRMFYRLFIMFDKGVYLFTPSRRPVRDTTQLVKNAIPIDKAIVYDTMNKAKPVVIQLNGATGTDTLSSPNAVTVKNRNTYTPSIYVFTCRDGYVCIRLPGAEKAIKYSLKFFDNEETLIFELKEIRDREFKIDKANFYHAGWFRFELYEDGKLFEKHKLYLDKDF